MYLKQTIGVALVGLTLSACSQIREDIQAHRNPELSPIDMSHEAMPESNIINVPMPEREVRPAPVRAERASLWARDSTGFFGDNRAASVGDILTINIQIDDEAQLRNASNRSRESGNAFGLDGFLGYESQLGRVLPGLTAEDIPTGDIVDLSATSSSRGQGAITRSERINMQVAAMIVQRLDNGNLVVAGRQEVRVNNELRELRVAGIIRPGDIEMNNSISYEKIAEARITYAGAGQISRVQQPRYGEDALDVILPY